MFKDFGRRLQRDLKRTVEARLSLSYELSGGKLKVRMMAVAFASINLSLSLSAQTYRCERDHTSHAALCCVVWRQHVGKHGKPTCH